MSLKPSSGRLKFGRHLREIAEILPSFDSSRPFLSSVSSGHCAPILLLFACLTHQPRQRRAGRWKPDDFDSRDFGVGGDLGQGLR